MVEDILRQEFGSRDFQFQDIGQGRSNFVFQVRFDGKHESNSDQNVPTLLQTAIEIHQVHSDRCSHLGRLNHCRWSAYVHDMVRGDEHHFLEKVPDPKYIECVLTGYPEAANFSLLHGNL